MRYESLNYLPLGVPDYRWNALHLAKRHKLTPHFYWNSVEKFWIAYQPSTGIGAIGATPSQAFIELIYRIMNKSAFGRLEESKLYFERHMGRALQNMPQIYLRKPFN